MKPPRILLFFVIIALLWGAQGCVYSQGGLAPTEALDATQALYTVQALLTMTAPAQPASPASPSSTAIPSTPSPPTATSSSPSQTHSGSPSPTAACNLAAAGSPIDVTIPDDSVLAPGQTFTKIWKLENAGSCNWTKDYAAVFLYGEMMGALGVVPIASNVAPRQSIEIAVEMFAPLKPGNYQGNWKLRDTEGNLFGIGPAGESPFWVRIVVAQPVNGTPTSLIPPTITPTPTETPLPTPLPSPTTQVAVQNELTLVVDNLLDLDQALTNPVQGADLAYRTGSITFHWLIPQGEAVLGIFGSQLPGLLDCQTASMSAASIPVESLSPALYLCYRTSQGQVGWLQILDFNRQTFTLTLDLLTWVTP